MTHTIQPTIPHPVQMEPIEYRNFVIGSTEVKLPKVRISDNCSIWLLNIMGGFPFQIETYARDLISGFTRRGNNPSYIKMVNTIVAPEGKSIPLAYEVAKQLEIPYVILRKQCKSYMGLKTLSSPIYNAITSASTQSLYLDEKDFPYVDGRTLMFIDDVISTGATMETSIELVKMANGKISWALALALEGDYCPPIPTYYLINLPLEG